MKHIALLTVTMSLFVGMASAQNDNPFFEEWKTPFQVPPFEKIETKHYLPAFHEGMQQQQKEIEAIISNPQKPTFENTMAALDRSGELLRRVSAVFYALNSANTNKEMQEIARELSPLTTKHSDDINLNPALFKRISVLYEQKANLKLDPQQMRLLTETYKDFLRAGAGLVPEQQNRLRQLNSRIDLLQLTFGQNLLAENKSYKLVLENKSSLAGLPDDVIKMAGETANEDPATKGKWVFTLNNPSFVPFMQYSDNRDLREKLLNAYLNRSNHNNDKDNKAVIRELVQLRTEKANLLGYKTWADFALENRMALNPDNVYNLLGRVWTPALDKANEELTMMQKIIDGEHGTFSLEAYDWQFYSEKLKKQLYSLDEEIVRPYFKLENVRDGVFKVAGKLYGITFTEIKDAPRYLKEVSVYECRDTDGSHLGVVYFDFHPRAGKRGGAWCGSFRPQAYVKGKRVAPVMTIVTNFSGPSAGKPALLSSDEVETLFHEFGHALHGLLKNVKYYGLAVVPRDFVELPSQIMEHWAFEPEVLKMYANHFETGTVIPDELVKRIVSSNKYGQGFKTTEYLAACYLDMDYHASTDIPGYGHQLGQQMGASAEIIRNAADANVEAVEAVSDKQVKQVDSDVRMASSEAEMSRKPSEADAWVLDFEAKSMEKIGLIRQIPPRYRSTYFQHSMTGGYTAGYYSYIWAEVLDADAFDAFRATGNIFDKATAAKFRKFILEPGGSKDAMQMYVDFRGREPGIEPLLENRGLNK